MRAAVLGPGGLAIGERPDPVPRAGEVLVAPTRVGMCGSDVHLAIDGSARPAFLPIVLGHEPAGRIAALGPGADDPPVGTRVAVVPMVSCLECDQCRRGRSVLCRRSEVLGVDRDGALAELVAVPARNVIEIPAGLDDALAAVATDAVATAYHAVATRGGVSPGARVVVWGVGGLGLAAVAIARRLGAASVFAVDPREAARERALEAGAEAAFAPADALAGLRAGGGADVALEFVGGEETVEAAVRSLDRGGRAVVVGVGAGKASAGRLITFVPQERELVSSWGSEPAEVERVLELLAGGELTLPRMIGETISLDEVPAALERLARGETSGARIVVDMEVVA